MTETPIDITDLLSLLEEQQQETIAIIARLAVAEIRRLRGKIEELKGENAQPA